MSVTIFSPLNMTDYALPTPFVVEGSGAYASSSEEWMIFNGVISASNFWTTNSTSSGWVSLDLGSGNAKKLKEYSLTIDSTASDLDRMPKDWTMQGSNNNSDWDTLDTVTGEISWANSEVRTFVCDVYITSYRYFKINITANNGAGYLQLAELRLYEQDTEISAPIFIVKAQLKSIVNFFPLLGGV